MALSSVQLAPAGLTDLPYVCPVTTVGCPIPRAAETNRSRSPGRLITAVDLRPEAHMNAQKPEIIVVGMSVVVRFGRRTNLVQPWKER